MKQLINKEISIENLRKNKQKIINVLNRYNIKWSLKHVLYEDLYIIFYKESDIINYERYGGKWITKGYTPILELGLLQHSIDEVEECIKNINKYNTISDKLKERYKNVNGVKGLYKDGNSIKFILRDNSEFRYYIFYEEIVKKSMEDIYEEISTIIRNGLYPIDK